MKVLLLIAICSLALVGCQQHEHSDGDSHSHEVNAQSFSGATHKEGTGITLLPETEERLGVKLEEVREEKLSREITFTARVFAGNDDQVEASGILSAEDARHLKEGSSVKLQAADGRLLDGVVARSSSPISTNESEVIVRFSAPESSATVGSFLRVSASVPSSEAVTTVPKKALIKGTTESFVYVQNGDAYLRTVVEPGRESADAVEIEEGLLEGDLVVSQGAMDLWLVELRAVKGGQGCCPAPPVRGKRK